MKQLAWIVSVISFGLASSVCAQSPPSVNRIASRSMPGDAVASAKQLQLPPGASGPFSVESLASRNSSRQRDTAPAEMEAAKIIARVGDEVVLAGDLYGQVNQFLHSRLQEIPAEQRNQVTPELLRQRRWQLIRQVLPQVLDGKLIYLDFLRSIPKERIAEVQDSLYKAFDEQQLPILIDRAKVRTAADLDKLLRSFGSSLDQQRRTFAEQLAAVQWRQRNAGSKKEISHTDMINYYHEHIEEFRIEAKSRWEQLSALDSETFSREASRRLVAEMGNQVWGGAQFAAVAKRSSQGPTASEGGGYDWTTQGSLRSDVLDAAIFTLPPGRLSEILMDDDGCHIVRVVERQGEAFVPFAEAQSAIRDKIRGERAEAASREYVERLRDEFPVWTIFDDDPEFAQAP